jgi:hypothetical protein
MCRNSFASHRLMRGALSLCSCFRASDPALFAVDGSLLRAVNCARRRPLCEEKDDDTTAYRHLSPRTVAEISGVLFKERCLIKPTILILLVYLPIELGNFLLFLPLSFRDLHITSDVRLAYLATACK